MRIKIVERLNLWLEKTLSYPGCDKRDLYYNLLSWKATAFVVLYAPILILGLLIFAPEATLFIHYGYGVLILMAATLLLHTFLIRHFFIVIFLNSLILQLLTFYYIIKLGGIPTSGGLVLANITQTIMTLPRQKFWYSTSMFIFYMFLVVLMVILKPWLEVPDQITPALNSTLYAINTVLMSTPVFFIVLNYIKRERKFEELEINHLREMNELENRLFTNITHEFRTPLTVIKGMTGLVRNQPEEWAKTGLQKIETNSNILLRLVNQMLDMAKIEKGALKVSYTLTDINRYTSYIVELFQSEAYNRKIDLKFVSEGKPFLMDIDSDKLMHILSNLISNALKYTSQGGQVEISTREADNGNKFLISVKDTGSGIKKEDLIHIFDRFYRAGNGMYQSGTGLGLALTKELIELLHGTISVDSMPGKGSEFTLSLPVTRSAKRSDIMDEWDRREVSDIIEGSLASSEAAYGPQDLNDQQAGEVAGELETSPLLLIVEDNPDVVQYLKAILKRDYRVEVALNGKFGIAKATELVPDIILSDVMMPVMDGIELLETLKNDMRTSHIPVVMLTAKSDIDSKLTGLEKGADAYLAKPFNEKELHAQLDNLIRLRRKLQEHYSSMNLQEIREEADKSLDARFMRKVISLIDENLDDDRYGILELCTALGMSRAQIYRKFKSLTDKTLHEYLRSYRLRKAREMILTTDLTISEVAYRTGFKTLSHFSRVFSEEFGENPSGLTR